MIKLDTQFFSATIPYEFIISKENILTDGTVTGVKVILTPDTSQVGDLGVDVEGNQVYINDDSTFELEGWTKSYDGNASLYKIYTSNATENIEVEYMVENTNIVYFSGTVEVTEIGIKQDEPVISPTNKYIPVGWEDGELISPAVADLVTGEVTPAKMRGKTPVSAENLKHMDEAILDLYNGGATTNEIIISPEQPTTDDWKIWIDSDEVQNLGSEVINTLAGNQKNKAPSVYAINNVINNIGTITNLFGDVMGSVDNKHNVNCYSSVNATKINNNIWKFDIQGQLAYTEDEGYVDYFDWGFDIQKISNLLNSKLSVQVEYNDMSLYGHYQYFKNTIDESIQGWGTLDLTKISYGTRYELKHSRYLIPSRFYTKEGDCGGFPLHSFTNPCIIQATIYLREKEN